MSESRAVENLANSASYEYPLMYEEKPYKETRKGKMFLQQLTGDDGDLKFLAALFMAVLGEGERRTSDLRLALIAATAVEVPYRLSVGSRKEMEFPDKGIELTFEDTTEGRPDFKLLNTVLLESFEKALPTDIPEPEEIVAVTKKLADKAGSIRIDTELKRRRHQICYNSALPLSTESPHRILDPQPGLELTGNFYDYAVQLAAIGKMIGQAYRGEDIEIPTFNVKAGFEYPMETGTFRSYWESSRDSFGSTYFKPNILLRF